MGRVWLKNIDYDKRILEIGPLHIPNISKDRAKNLFYADIRTTEEIISFYRNNPDVITENIVEIDYVIKNSYTESLNNIEKFDYVIATHVIEHIPRLISFFEDISNILNPNGKLCLAIPDKRYCFDHFRCPTSFAECYDIYTRGISNLPVRVLDHYISSTINDPIILWKGNTSKYIARNKERFRKAKENYLKSLNGEYIDVHFSVFTPETFLLFLFYMLNFNILPFKCIEFYGTEYYSNEFNCVLEFDKTVIANNSDEIENILNLLKKNKDDHINFNLINWISGKTPKKFKFFLKKIF